MEEVNEKQLYNLIESLQQYIIKVPNGCNKIAEFLRNGERMTAYNSINDFIEGMDWITSSLEILSGNNYIISFDREQLNKLLLELNDALIKQDEGVIADLFDYEIADFFEEVDKLNIVKAN